MRHMLETFVPPSVRQERQQPQQRPHSLVSLPHARLRLHRYPPARGAGVTRPQRLWMAVHRAHMRAGIQWRG
jgi:hypothetical protein